MVLVAHMELGKGAGHTDGQDLHLIPVMKGCRHLVFIVYGLDLLHCNVDVSDTTHVTVP